MLLLAGGLGWLVVVYPERSGPGQGAVTEVVLPAGATPASAAAALHRAGALADAGTFTWYARAMGASDRLRQGTVVVRDDMSPRSLLRRIARGYGATELRITIPEGYSRFDIAALLQYWHVCSADAFVAATADAALLSGLGVDAADAEGYLFPDTYRIRDDERAEEVVARLVANARRRLAGLRAKPGGRWDRLADVHGWGERELLTLASIVEKEAGVARERPTIAGVFLNRLGDPDFRPRRLQADPTVAYGCLVQPDLPPCRSFDGRRVTRRMTADADNRYNTYRHDGLPPGPIANPGLGSLRAVLAPAAHDYYYFVARGGGEHAFSATLEEHNAAVARYRR